MSAADATPIFILLYLAAISRQLAFPTMLT